MEEAMNFPPGTYEADPRAPWNQLTPAEEGMTCGVCGNYDPAPKEWAYTPFGHCPFSGWVRAADPACDCEFEVMRNADLRALQGR